MSEIATSFFVRSCVLENYLVIFTSEDQNVIMRAVVPEINERSSNLIGDRPTELVEIRTPMDAAGDDPVSRINVAKANCVDAESVGIADLAQYKDVEMEGAALCFGVLCLAGVKCAPQISAQQR
ncbi:hypothetical protein LTR04_004367 [Oleoguttula sp. CCFEE 6159]|nr:hypothetical protein LTR04_004367 [Oleoguttula sp. CCFEE 6159]